MRIGKNSNQLFEFGSWDRGQWLDRWSAMHILWGAVYALIFRMLGLTKLQSFIFMLAIAIAWEVYERLTGVLEPLPNSVLDIVFNVLGFWLVLYLLPSPKFTTQALITILLVIVAFAVRIISRR